MSVLRFLRRSRWDEERAREIEAHLAHEIDRQLARGMTPAQARAAALRQFGSPTRVREQIYDSNTIGWLETVRLDLRDALRQLRRRRGTTLASALLLAIGIASSTAAFAVARGVLLRDLPYPEASRLVTLWQEFGNAQSQISYPDLRDLRSLPAFDRVAAMTSGIGTLMHGTDIDRVTLVEGEPDLMPLLGARAERGRLPLPSDAPQKGAAISHRLWDRVFHRDPAVVGQTFELSGTRFTIIGVVAPLEFELPVGAGRLGTAFTVKDVDLWTALDSSDEMAGSRAISSYEALARLAPEVTLAQAQSALDARGAAMAAAYADTNRGRSFRAVPLQRQVVGTHAAAIWMACGGALLILAIGCVNAASLALGELPRRRRDFALREALGAGRLRLLRQVVWESALLSVVAAAAGVAGVFAIVRTITTEVALPRAADVRIDAAVVAFATIAALGSALVSRALPLARLEGGASGLRGSTSPHASHATRLRRILVTAQVALALVLCGTGALLGVSLRSVLAVDAGFNRTETLSARLSAYPQRYKAKPDVVRFFDELTARLQRHPDVIAAGVGMSVPLSGSTTGTSVLVQGRPQPMTERETAGWQAVGPGYFQAMGMPLRAGRDFTAADRTRAQHHTIINEALARRLFGSGDAVGRRLQFGPDDDPDWHEVIGVVGDVRHQRLTDAPEPRAYDLFGEHWSRTMYVVVRTRTDAAGIAAVLRREAHAIDPDVPVFQVATMAQLTDTATADRQAAAVLGGGTGVVSLTLAMLGIYGLLASSVSGRTRELGVRRALGATGGQLARAVAGEALAMSLAGIAVGTVVVLASARAIQSQLYGVSATNPLVLAAVAATLLGVAMVAALGPARRAATVDPSITLKVE